MIEPRVMQLLVALRRANGAVVSKDDLGQLFWEGRIVGEDAINRVVSRLRAVAEKQAGGVSAPRDDHQSWLSAHRCLGRRHSSWSTSPSLPTNRRSSSGGATCSSALRPRRRLARPPSRGGAWNLSEVRPKPGFARERPQVDVPRVPSINSATRSAHSARQHRLRRIAPMSGGAWPTRI